MYDLYHPIIVPLIYIVGLIVTIFAINEAEEIPYISYDKFWKRLLAAITVILWPLIWIAFFIFIVLCIVTMIIAFFVGSIWWVIVGDPPPKEKPFK